MSTALTFAIMGEVILSSSISILFSKIIVYVMRCSIEVFRIILSARGFVRFGRFFYLGCFWKDSQAAPICIAADRLFSLSC